MTAPVTLLTALREHKDVVKARETLDGAWSPFDNPGVPSPAMDAYDRALVTACLQEAAKRIRSQALTRDNTHRLYTAAGAIQETANLIDQMAKESAE